MSLTVPKTTSSSSRQFIQAWVGQDSTDVRENQRWTSDPRREAVQRTRSNRRSTQRGCPA